MKLIPFYGMMKLTEDMYIHIADTVFGHKEIQYQGQELICLCPGAYDHDRSCEKYSVDFDTISSDDEAVSVAKKRS